jgi:N-glycosylase/DNA lyase
MEFKNDEKNFYILNADNFSLAETLDCGQAFRWSEVDGVWQAVVGNRLWQLAQEENRITVFNCSEEEFKDFIVPYFDLERDYGAIASAVSENEVFRNAVALAGGIRILRQEPWECVCSFIISQNNNIPRIKKIISALSEKYGEKIVQNNTTYYTFPTAKALFDAGEEAIFALKTGFRAKYIIDASQKWCDGTINEEELKQIESLEDAIDYLCKVKGIGLKVASCALLFGFERHDPFPVDVWMKRVLDKYFEKDFSPATFGRYAGVAQQYLFDFERNSG